MEPIAVGFMGFGLVLLLVLLGVHVGIALWLTGFIGILAIKGTTTAVSSLVYNAFTTTTSYTLAIIPLFMLMGEFVTISGAVTNLYQASRSWLGRIPGGLAVVALLTNTGLAACVGSSLASTAMVTRTVLPEMEKHGYDKALSLAVIAVSGTLAVLIPPSVFLIFYAMLAHVSIGKMLLAGFLPGLWNAFLFFVLIIVLAKFNPTKMPLGPSFTWKEKLSSLKGFWGVSLIILAIFGGLYTGVVTSTEVGGLGVLVALVLVIVARKAKWGLMRGATWNATWSTAMLFFVIIGAFVFSTFLALSGASGAMAKFIIGLEVPTFVKFAGIIIIFLLLGCFVDAFSMLAITLPIFLPAVMGLGFDLIWFGIICVVMVEVAGITPPLGITVYTATGIAGPDVEAMAVFRACLPFVGVQILTVITLYFVPQIVLFLPSIARL